MNLCKSSGQKKNSSDKNLSFFGQKRDTPKKNSQLELELQKYGTAQNETCILVISTNNLKLSDWNKKCNRMLKINIKINPIPFALQLLACSWDLVDSVCVFG